MIKITPLGLVLLYVLICIALHYHEVGFSHLIDDHLVTQEQAALCNKIQVRLYGFSMSRWNLQGIGKGARLSYFINTPLYSLSDTSILF